MRPPFGARANVVMVRSISPVSRTLNALNSTLKDGARASIAPNCPLLEATIRILQNRHAPDAGCDLLEPFQPFATHPILERNKSSGVATWPRHALHKPGADRIDNIHEDNRHGADSSAATRRSRRNVGETATEHPGRVRANSAAFRRLRSASATPQRYSICTLRLGVQPKSCIFSQKRRQAGLRLRCILSVVHEHPDAPHTLRLLRPPSRGQQAAAPPSSVMNSRRFIRSPRRHATKSPSADRHRLLLAVLKFTTISNFVGCSIGKSEGTAPRAIRSTNSATRAKSAVMLGP